MQEKLLQFIETYNLHEYANRLFHWEHFEYLCGATLILVVISFYYVYHKYRNPPLRVFENETGSVTISRRVLDDIVYSSCANIDIASKPATRYKIRKKQIDLYIRIQLGQGQLINETTKRLQDHLARELRDSLGIHDIGRIDIEVTGASTKIRPMIAKPEPVKVEPEKSIEA